MHARSCLEWAGSCGLGGLGCRRQGEMLRRSAGLNTGVMMVRNTDWSRSLLDQTAHFGQFPPNMTTEQVGPAPRWQGCPAEPRPSLQGRPQARAAPPSQH